MMGPPTSPCSIARAGGSRLGARMATGQPLPLLGEDDAEKQEEGRLVQFREDWCG